MTEQSTRTVDLDVRDAAERVIRSWDAHEKQRGGRQVIDYDCYPPAADARPVEAAASRLDVMEQLVDLHAQAAADDPDQAGPLEPALRAHLTYLRGVLGERAPIEEYIHNTQGVHPDGWPAAYVGEVADRARAALDGLGVGWGPTTGDDLNAVEGHLDLADAQARALPIAAGYEPAVRALTGTDAPFQTTVEIVDVDDYWAYWLDGAGTHARMRFNLRQAVFTETRLHQFVIHELLGHALQCASYSTHAAARPVDWLRLMSVHLPHQVCLEGLATAWPLFIAPDDQKLIARTRLDHYQQLVRAELHLLINHGATVAECAARARARVPWWSNNTIANELADRGTDPMLRSYLWSYPVGTDWFTRLADHASPATIADVLAAAYQRPLTPTDLDALAPLAASPIS